MKFVYTLCLGTVILALGCPLYAAQPDTNNEQTTESETAPQAKEDNVCTICVDKKADFTTPCCKNKAICSECWDRATKDYFSCPFCRKIDETKRAAASDRPGTRYGSDDAMSYETLQLLQQDLMSRMNRLHDVDRSSHFRDSFYAGLGNTTPALVITPASFGFASDSARFSPADVGYQIFSNEISVSRSLRQVFSNAWSFLRTEASSMASFLHAEASSTASMFMPPDCPHFTWPTIFGCWSNNSTARTQDEEDPTFLTIQGFNVDEDTESITPTPVDMPRGDNPELQEDDVDSTSLRTRSFDLDEGFGFMITPSPTPVATLQSDKPVPKPEINSATAKSTDFDKKGSSRFIEVLALAVVVGASVLLYQKPHILRSPKTAHAA